MESEDSQDTDSDDGPKHAIDSDEESAESSEDEFGGLSDGQTRKVLASEVRHH